MFNWPGGFGAAKQHEEDWASERLRLASLLVIMAALIVAIVTAQHLPR